jgi:TolB protein
LFENTSENDAEFLLTLNSTVADKDIWFSLEGTSKNVYEERSFALNLRSDDDVYLRRRAAQVTNRIIQELFKISGPMGSSIVYSQTMDGLKVLYLNTFARPELSTQLTYNLNSNSEASWSPDQTKIVYTSHTQRGTTIVIQQVFPLSLETHTVFQDGGKASGPFWSANNDVYLTLHVSDKNSDIYRFSVSSSGTPVLSNKKRITSNSAIETEGKVSPDGKYLAYVSDRTGSPQIYLLNLATNSRTRLSKKGGYNVTPVWSPNSSSIAYRGIRGGVSSIYRIDIDTTEERKLTPNSVNAEAPTWSPDGSLVAFVGKQGSRVPKIFYALASGGNEYRRLTNTSSEIEESSPSWGAALR